MDAAGQNKFDVYAEEGWTLLPSGKVLTVDAYVFKGASCAPTSEIFSLSTQSWSSAGSTINQLSDCNTTFPSFEMGPQPLRPDRTVVAFGATTEGTAHTSIYSSSTGIWSAGPNLPTLDGVPYILADAPAAVEPSGAVLFAASPGDWTESEEFPTPTHFWELSFSGNTITQVTDNPDGSTLRSYEYNFLVLPTGQILTVETDTPNVWIYTPSGSPNSAWAPTLSTFPTTVSRTHVYELTGTQFDGLTQGSFYGDDVQADTDRPLVKIVNYSTRHVFYEQTLDYTVSVASGAASKTVFFVAPQTETGASALFVVANGISSTGKTVFVN